MIESKERIERVSRSIAHKYGEEAIREVRPEEYEKIQEYYDDIAMGEKEINYDANIEQNETVAIVDGKQETITRDKSCKFCNKQELFLRDKDMFYIIKHGVCEKCFYKHLQ